MLFKYYTITHNNTINYEFFMRGGDNMANKLLSTFAYQWHREPSFIDVNYCENNLRKSKLNSRTLLGVLSPRCFIA